MHAAHQARHALSKASPAWEKRQDVAVGDWLSFEELRTRYGAMYAAADLEAYWCEDCIPERRMTSSGCSSTWAEFAAQTRQSSVLNEEQIVERWLRAPLSDEHQAHGGSSGLIRRDEDGEEVTWAEFCLKYCDSAPVDLGCGGPGPEVGGVPSSPAKPQPVAADREAASAGEEEEDGVDSAVSSSAYALGGRDAQSSTSGTRVGDSRRRYPPPVDGAAHKSDVYNIARVGSSAEMERSPTRSEGGDLRPGDSIEVVGLESEMGKALNGQAGTVISFDAQKG
eukprot:CAMPEP_0178370014 /NCGR_PEP_ID=MMETSP0689_2-20121128/77_1 /TAXON_ID=160604 /ORGANISM="Amphidinium massartii, Strain CS-259" /LENGTH=280 /DNA_ID=CAMNT_0019989809 /DNA_START=99 /DNA_END=939 /DNA_ORIENTATION=-